MSIVELADLRFDRAVERLHGLGPRALAELLSELAANRLLRTEIEMLVTKYCRRLERATLIAVGGDRLPHPPIHLVVEHLHSALGHLRDAEAAANDYERLHHLDVLGAAVEDALDLAKAN